MLYVLHGSDVVKGQAKLRALVDGLLKKKPDAALLRFDEESFDPAQLDELIYGRGLFSAKSIVVLRGVFASVEGREAMLERLSDIAASGNVFVLFEEKLDAKTRAKLARHAEKIQAFDVGKLPASERFNVFALTDALGRRDGKMLWVLYQKAKRSGVTDEEVHGLLFWQAKCLLLAEASRSATEANLNPFVFKKALGFLRNYSAGERRRLSFELVRLYHDARRGRSELGTALERFILNV